MCEPWLYVVPAAPPSDHCKLALITSDGSKAERLWNGSLQDGTFPASLDSRLGNPLFPGSSGRLLPRERTGKFWKVVRQSTRSPADPRSHCKTTPTPTPTLPLYHQHHHPPSEAVILLSLEKRCPTSSRTTIGGKSFCLHPAMSLSVTHVVLFFYWVMDDDNRTKDLSRWAKDWVRDSFSFFVSS
jgi:hypothetical protein